MAIEGLAQVTAPPYDVISPKRQDELYERSPFNIVRMILGKEHVDDDEYNNKYQRAASFLKDWKSSGALMDDPGKNFYIYQQEYKTPDKKTRVRTGFFAAIRLERPGKGNIHAHEHTFEGPKADRLKLLRSTHCNLSPIFCLYSDPSRESDKLLEEVLSQGPPRMELTDDEKVTHRLWLISDMARIKRLSALLQDKAFFIADGHHRYETALNYYEEMKDAKPNRKDKASPYAYTLSFLMNCEAPGLEILPTHRVLSGELGVDVEQEEILEDLEEFFDLKPVKVNLKKADSEGAALCKKIETLGKKTSAFALVFPGGRGFILTLKPKSGLEEELPEDLHRDVAVLDVSIMHEYIIPRIWIGNPEMELDDLDIFYLKDAGEALRMLGAPTYACAVFLMNAPTMEHVRRIASQNLRMPHKSTYFYPKLLTGLVLRDHSVT